MRAPGVHRATLLLNRRLPEFDAVAFRIGDPGKLAVFVLLDLGVDRDAFLTQ